MEQTFLQKLLSLFSRKTYTVTPESFSAQFEGVDSGSLKDTNINNPLSRWDNPLPMTFRYKANQIKKITVLDKNGASVILNNSPSLEARITLKDGKRRIFYFDTLILEDGSLVGSKSRFIPKLSGKILFTDIQKIEVQEGGKKFSYQ